MYPQLFEDLAGPVQGQVYERTHSTTAARFETPPDWKQAIVTFISLTSNLKVAFGGPGVMVDDSARAIVLGETIAPHWSSGGIVPAGGTQNFPVGLGDTYFSVDSDGTSGSWCAFVSSGNPQHGEDLDKNSIGTPLLWLDPGRRSFGTLDSGAITIANWKCRVNSFDFAEGTNKPDFLNAAASFGVSSALTRPAFEFVRASSEKLVCTNATLAAALGGTNPFTLFIAARRGEATQAHTLFSVGTTASNNGRWDFTINASEDPIMTRVDSAGSSTNSTHAETIASGDFNLYTWTFDGTTPLFYENRASVALTGTAAGDVGTTTKVAVGCRAYNTSTADQFAYAEVMDVIVFASALSTEKLGRFHDWAKRRYGK